MFLTSGIFSSVTVDIEHNSSNNKETLTEDKSRNKKSMEAINNGQYSIKTNTTADRCQSSLNQSIHSVTLAAVLGSINTDTQARPHTHHITYPYTDIHAHSIYQPKGNNLLWSVVVWISSIDSFHITPIEMHCCCCNNTHTHTGANNTQTTNQSNATITFFPLA